MDVGIGRVFELLGNDGARGRDNDFVGLGDRALHALRGRREHELGTQQRQHLAALDGH